MKNLNGKKILIISSDSNDISFVKAAKELGVYTICCDRYTDWKKSPAKAYADESWNIDYSDIETVVKKCKERKIDGVIAGYSEERVLAACRIAKKIGTPFYTTEDQIEITRNKRRFKELCNQYNISTPKEFCKSLPMTEKEIEDIKYPVIVKPSDNGGRKGISVCKNRRQLEQAIDLAEKESKNHEIVIEEYITGMELCAIYTLSDGEISLSCLNDKFISEDEDGTSRLCAAVLTPSRYYEQYIKEIDLKIKKLLKKIGARNGVANFQFIVDKNEIKAFEMGFRVNGNDDYKVIRKYNNIDFIKMLITFSLTGSMGDDLSKDDPVFEDYNCTLCLYLKSGVIGRIDYEKIKNQPEIYDIFISKIVGNKIVANGTTGQKAGMIKFSSDSVEKLIDITHFIQDNIKIEDETGKNMILYQFYPEHLLKKD